MKKIIKICLMLIICFSNLCVAKNRVLKGMFIEADTYTTKYNCKVVDGNDTNCIYGKNEALFRPNPTIKNNAIVFNDPIELTYNNKIAEILDEYCNKITFNHINGGSYEGKSVTHFLIVTNEKNELLEVYKIENVPKKFKKIELYYNQ